MGNSSKKISTEQTILNTHLNASNVGTHEFYVQMSNLIINYFNEREIYVNTYRNVCNLLNIEGNVFIYCFANPSPIKFEDTLPPVVIQLCINMIHNYVEQSITTDELKITINKLQNKYTRQLNQ